MVHDLNELKEELYESFNLLTKRAKSSGDFREWSELRKVAAEIARAIAAVEHEIAAPYMAP